MKKYLFSTLLLLSALSTQAQTARIQILHNSADPALDTVDIWVGNTLVANNMAFRTATAFMDITAGTPVIIGVAPKNSTTSADALDQTVTTFSSGQTYIATASGVLGTGFSPLQNFALNVYASARETATSGSNTDVLIFHGSTDALNIDLRNQNLSATTYASNLAYGSYNPYLELITADSIISLTYPNINLLNRYHLRLSTLNLSGQAVTLLASGFINPASNSNGEDFGLWLVTAAGGNMIELPIFAPVGIEMQVSPDLQLRAWPVPTQTTLFVSFFLPTASDENTAKVIDISGRVLQQISLSPLGEGANQIEIHTANLSAGTYFLQLLTPSGGKTLPFVVAP
jgi:hypothetical protein